ncbi:hypothetical protein AI27_14660 [Sphingomonas sp. BHC-A]|uniref:Uncharacterized protein n=2 Tax=Sphingobium indicum TaxID=332055 RepID=A0A1L5BSV9_SPHIB|nr:hypothetical protein SIDU_16495 [Sphingobium indicum B90A]KEZ00072.1 hypothetical protein AI27_14660 [Sphingomonas sp. BHC-A]
MTEDPIGSLSSALGVLRGALWMDVTAETLDIVLAVMRQEGLTVDHYCEMADGNPLRMRRTLRLLAKDNPRVPRSRALMVMEGNLRGFEKINLTPQGRFIRGKLLEVFAAG